MQAQNVVGAGGGVLFGRLVGQLVRGAGLAVIVIGLSACATPSTVLKNPKTGQVARCGGSTTGSMLGGYIGHSVQKDQDAKCVREYEAQGFKRSQ